MRLRWSHASRRRAIRRRLRELAELEYRLLAEIAEAGCVAASSHTAALRCKRAELRAEIARAEKLALGAVRAPGGPDARRRVPSAAPPGAGAMTPASLRRGAA
jgi:hypothetical protein